MGGADTGVRPGDGTSYRRLHLPGAGMDQAPEQERRVRAAGGVPGPLPPRQPQPAAHGGAQDPGDAAPSSSIWEAVPAVLRRHQRGGGAAGGGLRRPATRMGWTQGRVREDDGHGWVLLPGDAVGG